MFVFIWYCCFFPNHCLLKGLTLEFHTWYRFSYELLYQRKILSTDYFPYLLHLLPAHYDIYIDGLYFPFCSSYPAIYPTAVAGKNTQSPPQATFFVSLLTKFCLKICNIYICQQPQANWDSRSRECQRYAL